MPSASGLDPCMHETAQATSTSPGASVKPWALAEGWSWLTVAGMLIVIIGLWVADSRILFESPFLLTILNLGFCTVVLLLIAGLIGRSFLARGEPGLLLLGCGALVWALAGFAAARATYRDVNITPCISAVSGFISAGCHLAGVWISLHSRVPLRQPRNWLLIGYALSALCVGSVAWGAFAGWIPVFFVQGHGGTPLRYVLLTLAILMFSVTAGLLMEDYRTRRSSFSYYYALALSLIAAGFFGVMIQRSVFSALFWVSVSTQLIGGIYMLLAALSIFGQTHRTDLSLSPLGTAWRASHLRIGLKQQGPLKLFLRYTAAAVAVGAAAGLRWLCTEWLGPGLATYVTFFPAMMAVALLAGFGPGLLATVLSVFAVRIWLLPPTGHFSLAAMPGVDRFGLVLFAGSGLFMSIVAELYRRNRDRLAAYDRAAAVREAQARLATFAEATFEGIVQSEDGRILDCNEQFACMTGYTTEELRGLDFAALIVPEDRARVMADMVEARQSCVEHGAIRKDGSRITVEARARIVSPGSKRRHTVLRDITDRKRMEEALREADRRMEAHLANSPLAIIAFDSAYRITLWSGAAERVFGWKAEEILGRRIADLKWVHEDDQALVDRVSEDMLTGRQARNFNINRNYRKDGSIAYCEWYNSAIYDREGRLASVFSQVLDVTERKRAERERDQFFELSLDIIAIASEQDARWKRVSPAFTRILGWTASELLEMPNIEVIVHPDDVQRSRQAFAELVSGRPLVQFEHRLRSKTGTYRWIAWNTNPAPAEGLFYCVGRDITDRRETEEALRRAEEALRKHAGNLEELVKERTARLQETVHELEQYSYSISHDMRAPLRAMNQYSQFLLDDFEQLLPEEGRMYLRRISAASVRLDRLIQDVLTYHQIARSDMTLARVDLDGLSRAIIEEYPVIHASGAQVEVVSPLLPVQANLAALTQCLSNLLVNAVKFTAPGTKPKIRLWTEQRDGWVRVCVQDNGLGIEQNSIHRIWDIFQQVHECGAQEGTGIGLSIVKKAVERMGGRVGVESQPGLGSRFWFELHAPTA